MALYNEIDPAWKNHETYSVENAVALMAGVAPNNVIFDPVAARFRGSESVVIGTDAINKIYGYFKMLKSAIEDGKLKAHIIHSARSCKNDNDNPGKDEGIIHKYEWFNNDKDDIGRHDIIYSATPDWSKTTIRQDHLIEWLKGIEYHDMFFDPDPASSEDKYWDILEPKPHNKHFAPKLAALIRAWRIVNDIQSNYYFENYKTPKQALVACLKENTESWFLIEEGDEPLKDDALQKLAAIANWDKTPGPR